MTYYEQLDLDLIQATEPIKQRIDNGSYLLTMQFSIKNTETIKISAYRLPLIPYQYYTDLGNITSFDWVVSGSRASSSGDYEIADSWIWSPEIQVYPGEDLSIEVNAVFEALNNE